MPRIVREQAPQIAIVGLGRVDKIKRALLFVIIAERLVQRAERIDLFPMRQSRSLAGNLAHQLVDIFELFERGPVGVAGAPMRAWPQPYGKSLGEVLIGMTLRIPQPQVLNVIAAGGIGPVVPRIMLR